MIKQAEVQNAYLLGRQAAMEKLAFTFPTVEGILNRAKREEATARKAKQDQFLSDMAADPDLARESARLGLGGDSFYQAMNSAFDIFPGSSAKSTDKDFYLAAGSPAADDYSSVDLKKRLIDQSFRENSADKDFYLAAGSPAAADYSSVDVAKQLDDLSFYQRMLAGAAKAREDASTPEMQARMQTAINNATGPMNHDKDFVPTPGLPTPSGLNFDTELGRQAIVADLIGLGGSGLRRSDIESDPLLANKINYLPQGGLDPMNLATMQNLSRAGMLGGAIGGTAIGGSPLAALTSTAGALGGGMLGGNLGRALGAGIAAYKDEGGGLMNKRTQNLVAGGGALGGLAGGLGAGYLT